MKIFIVLLAVIISGSSGQAFASCQPIDQLSGDPIWTQQCKVAGATYQQCKQIPQCQWESGTHSCQPIDQLSGDPLWIQQCQIAGATYQQCKQISQCQWN